jgi:hypothetical protein
VQLLSTALVVVYRHHRLLLSTAVVVVLAGMCVVGGDVARNSDSHSDVARKSFHFLATAHDPMVRAQCKGI